MFLPDQQQAHQSWFRRNCSTFSRWAGYVSPEETVSQEPELVEYNGLLWEARALQDAQGNKIWLRYDQSDARVKKEGMRHPYPWESGALICAGLEDKLSEPQKQLYGDCRWEWQNVAHCLDEQAKEVVFYLDPVFSWNNGYALDSHGKVLRIPAEKVKIGWNKISDLGDRVSVVYYGRAVKNLPRELKNAEVLLSQNVTPVARGVDYGGYLIYVDFRASRGVRTSVAKKSPEEIEVKEKY